MAFTGGGRASEINNNTTSGSHSKAQTFAMRQAPNVVSYFATAVELSVRVCAKTYELTETNRINIFQEWMIKYRMLSGNMLENRKHQNDNIHVSNILPQKFR